MPGFLAESRLLARASFLELILRLRPNVIKDLWNAVLPEFKRTVLRRFHSEIFGGISPQKYQKDADEFRKTSSSSGDYLVHLLQQRLSPGQMDLAAPDPVGEELFCYAQAQDNGHGMLLNAIDQWSRRWNLDAEWCRDHALTVLYAWLFNQELRWIGTLPSRLLPIQFEGWRSAFRDFESDADFSHFLVELAVESDGAPEPLRFTLQTEACSFSFETSWNIATENEAQFKKRLQSAMRLWLREAEMTQVTLLKQEDASDNIPVKVFERRLALTDLVQTTSKEEFEKYLQKYLSEMKAWHNKAKTENSLVEIPYKPCSKHLESLLHYQIPNEDGTCLSHSAIVDIDRESNGTELTTDSVRKTIAKVAKLIDLRLRNPHQHAGRPRGSGKQITHRATR